ncbi:MAG: LptF/LptG family permease [Treponema sp.]|jgi:lipopolysaccharide export system permease protein|nr:LptF/LptG family permease [Treponema sp.]
MSGIGSHPVIDTSSLLRRRQPSLPPPGRSISWTLFGYLVKDILFSFSISFLFFFFIFFVNQLLFMAQEILAKQVPLSQVALLLLFASPSVIALSAPFASLMGTLMTVGRLSSSNEVLVMLASGLSYRVIFAPAIAVGILISTLSFMANDILLPAGTIQFARLYRRILVSTPALELQPNSVKRFGDTVIVMGPVSGRDIENILILDRTGDGQRRLIMAENAELIDGGREGLSLDLFNVFVKSSREIVRDDYDYATSAFLRYWVPQEDFIQALTAIGPREMSSVDLHRQIVNRTQDQSQRVDGRSTRVLSQGLNLENSLRMGVGDSAWNRRENYSDVFSREIQAVAAMRAERSLLIYRLEFYKKFSIPFGALSFVFLAVALGLFAKKSGQAFAFIFGIFISVIYWTMLLGGQTVGIRFGYSPFWSMWLPNVLALSIGLILCIIRIRK